jgi:hypothetical protein
MIPGPEVDADALVRAFGALCGIAIIAIVLATLLGIVR